MRKYAALLALAALAAPLRADEVALQVQGGDVKTVRVDKVTVVKVDALVVTSFPFTVTAPAGAALYFWQYPAGVAATDMGERLEVTAAPDGPLTVSVKTVSADFDKKKFVTAFGRVTLNVGGVEPPKPPNPPQPPVPPGPAPVAGLKVLILYESSERKNLTAQQESILSGKAMRDWLIAHCSPDPAYQKGYAIWDKDADASDMPKHWRDAKDAPRAGLPWVVVMDGSGRLVGGFAMPADTAATIAELSKYLPKTQRKAA